MAVFSLISNALVPTVCCKQGDSTYCGSGPFSAGFDKSEFLYQARIGSGEKFPDPTKKIRIRNPGHNVVSLSPSFLSGAVLRAL